MNSVQWQLNTDKSWIWNRLPFLALTATSLQTHKNEGLFTYNLIVKVHLACKHRNLHLWDQHQLRMADNSRDPFWFWFATGFSHWFISHTLYKCLVVAKSNSICLLKDGQLHGGEHEGVDVFTLWRSVQRGFRGAAVDFGQRMLQQLNGGQGLWTQMRERAQRCPERSVCYYFICHSSLIYIFL